MSSPHCSWPARHFGTHFPATHAGSAFATVVGPHFVVQSPQCSIDPWESTHELPHVDCPSGHLTRHLITLPSFPQNGADVGQLVVQLPHVSGARRSASHPSSLRP